MDNKEDILDALNEFEKKPSPEIPQVLEQYLQHVAKTGKTLFPWPKLKKLFVAKVDKVMTDFLDCTNTDMQECQETRYRVLMLMEEFQGAPFTVQRICELILEPTRHYKQCVKFLRGMEKNMSVVSTVDPFGRKIVSESQAMVNGLDSNGHGDGLSKPNPFSSFPTPTQSAWTANIDKWFGTSDQTKTSSPPSSDNASPTGEGEGEDSEEDENLTEQILTENGEEESEEPKPCTSSEAEPTDSEEQNESKEETVSEETPDTPTSEETSQSKTDSDTQENVPEPSNDSDDKSESEVLKSNQAIDLCESAQNILESVNKACSEADETVSMAQKIIETDQQGQSEKTSSEKEDDPSVDQQTEEEEDNNQRQEQINEDSKSNGDSTENSNSTQPENDSECSQETPAGDGSGDACVSDAKKPRLSEDCESMDVDSEECSHSSNNVNSDCQNESVTECEKTEQQRLESIAEVKGHSAPMEQD